MIAIRLGALFTGAAAMLAAAPAEAQPDGGWYVAGAITRSFLNDAESTIFNAPVPGRTVENINLMEDGWGAHAAVGRAFGRLRVEADLGYTRNRSDRYLVTAPFTASVAQDGKQEATRLMLNAFVDVLDGPVQPYAGAGIGLADIHVRVFGARAPFPNEPPRELIDDSDRRFAYQLIGGAALRLSPSVALTAQYRWMDAGTIEGKDSRGERFIREHDGHNVDVGLRFRF